MALAQTLMTADDLWRMPDDGRRCVLIAGELRPMSPSSHADSWQAGKLAGSLGHHIDSHDLGALYVAETGFLLARDPDTVLAPDLAFVGRARVEASNEDEGSWLPGPPDLTVEVVSPNDRYTEVEETVATWLPGGALMVLVVNPRRRGVAVYEPGKPVRSLTAVDTIDGGAVVPGWTLPVADLFADRSGGRRDG